MTSSPFSYDSWLVEAKRSVESPTAISSVTHVTTHDETATTRRRYTDITRGTGKHKGWSRKGIELYNKIESKVEQQRGDPTLKDFEKKVKDLFKTGGKKRKDSPNGRDGTGRVRAASNLKRLKRALETNGIGIENFTLGQQEAI